MSSLLEAEIRQQPAVLAARSADGMDAAGAAARQLGDRGLIVAARGSSDNAARFAQYLLGSELRRQVSLAAPWLFRDADRAPHLHQLGVMAISQSGASPDIVAVLAAARGQQRPTVAICGHPDSPLAREADVTVDLACGEERSVAATKSYLASLHAVVQLAEAFQPDATRRRWLDRLPDLVEAMVTRELGRRAQYDQLLSAQRITVTGRGLFYSTAGESALKLRELSGTLAEAFSPPDLLHGPIAALGVDGTAWLIEPEDELAAVVDRVSPPVVVSTRAACPERAGLTVALPPDCPEWVAAILAVIPAQAAALRMSEQRGVDVDRPHGLRKVTLTS
jgi:glutamine---fructose-6-phosphate transaminase (isomerizing)